MRGGAWRAAYDSRLASGRATTRSPHGARRRHYRFGRYFCAASAGIMMICRRREEMHERAGRRRAAAGLQLISDHGGLER